MRRGLGILLALVLVGMMAVPGIAAPLSPSPIAPGGLAPIAGEILKPPVPVAFSAIPNRYTDVDPATQFDLNGDLTADLSVTATAVTGLNGTQVQLLNPAQLSLDQVQTVPSFGYSASTATQLSRVYVAKIGAGGYAKFLLVQVSPKITIWFHSGMPTASVLKADGTGGHAVLTWDALADAALGYNVYRYEYTDNFAYSVTLLNDFTVQATTFTDNTAENHYYLYVCIAMKADGSFGTQTTVVAVNVQSLQRAIKISLTAGTAQLDGAAMTVDSPPVIRSGRLMVPASLLVPAGVKVTVDSAGGLVTLVRRVNDVTYTVVMNIGAPDYTWNGNSYKADVPPYLAGSVVMIPLRVVAPALAFGLTFNSTDRTATLNWFE